MFPSGTRQQAWNRSFFKVARLWSGQSKRKKRSQTGPKMTSSRGHRVERLLVSNESWYPDISKAKDVSSQQTLWSSAPIQATVNVSQKSAMNTYNTTIFQQVTTNKHVRVWDCSTSGFGPEPEDYTSMWMFRVWQNTEAVTSRITTQHIASAQPRKAENIYKYVFIRLHWHIHSSVILAGTVTGPVKQSHKCHTVEVEPGWAHSQNTNYIA